MTDTGTAAPPAATTTPEDLVQVLRGVGLRVTEQRLAVLRALTPTGDDDHERAHLSAEDVHAIVVRDLPATPLQSVYLVLAALAGAGLLRRIEPAGSAARYERRVGDNHHHVVCTLCGAIADVDCSVGAAPCLTPSDSHGFAVVTAEVTYWGICQACAQAEAAAPAPAAPAPAAPTPKPHN